MRTVGPGVAVVVGILATLALAPVSLACSGTTAGTLEHVMRDADAIALVRVLKVTDNGGTWDYVLDVERRFKGDLGATWTIVDAGASDCGMGRLTPGERVLLEYWAPGRIVDNPPSPWFFDWRIDADGRVASDAIHEPSPTTLDELLAAYASLAPPDTATVESQLADPSAGTIPADLLAVFGGAFALSLGFARRRWLSPGAGSGARP